MQFTSSVLSLLAAATAAVQAIPGPAVEQRQEAPRIYAKFYNDTACGAEGGVWVEDTVWLQEPYDGSCIGVDIWTTFASTLIVDNFATRDRMWKPQLVRIQI